MKNELGSGYSSEDAVKTVRELTESLMGAIPAELIKFIRPHHTNSDRLRIQLLKAFYNSLTSEQKEAIQNEDRKLLFVELTTDQQVYLKQVFHQMWMWEIADAIEHPPLYVRALEESRFFLRGKPGEKKAVMSIRWESPQSDRQINIIKFGV